MPTNDKTTVLVPHLPKKGGAAALGWQAPVSQRGRGGRLSGLPRSKWAIRRLECGRIWRAAGWVPHHTQGQESPPAEAGADAPEVSVPIQRRRLRSGGLGRVDIKKASALTRYIGVKAARTR